MDLPMANATLTAVNAAGGSEDYDYSGSTGASEWTGSEGAYLTERVERVERGDESSVVLARSLIVDAELDITFNQGDTVTFTPTGGSAQTATVRRVARTKYPGAPGVVRLALEDA